MIKIKVYIDETDESEYFSFICDKVGNQFKVNTIALSPLVMSFLFEWNQSETPKHKYGKITFENSFCKGTLFGVSPSIFYMEEEIYIRYDRFEFNDNTYSAVRI